MGNCGWGRDDAGEAEEPKELIMVKFEQMLGTDTTGELVLYGDKPYLPDSGIEPALLVIKAHFNIPIPYPTITCVWFAIDTDQVAPDNYEMAKVTIQNPMWGMKKALLKILNEFTIETSISLPRLWPVGTYRVSFRSPDGTDGEDGQEIGSASFSIAAGILDGTPS